MDCINFHKSLESLKRPCRDSISSYHLQYGLIDSIYLLAFDQVLKYNKHINMNNIITFDLIKKLESKNHHMMNSSPGFLLSLLFAYINVNNFTDSKTILKHIEKELFIYEQVRRPCYDEISLTWINDCKSTLELYDKINMNNKGCTKFIQSDEYYFMYDLVELSDSQTDLDNEYVAPLTNLIVNLLKNPRTADDLIKHNRLSILESNEIEYVLCLNIVSKRKFILTGDITNLVCSSHHSCSVPDNLVEYVIDDNLTAYSYLFKNIQTLKVENILIAHKLLMDASRYNIGSHIETNELIPTGIFRDCQVETSNIIFIDHKEISDTMKIFIEYFNNSMKKLHEVTTTTQQVYEICATIHHMFITIHPFQDGNGRLGRILAALPLASAYNLDIGILYKNTKVYYEALQIADKTKNLAPLVNVFMENTLASIKYIESL
ncbi:MAG: Fic family protein [Cetobacterium sp.]